MTPYFVLLVYHHSFNIQLKMLSPPKAKHFHCLVMIYFTMTMNTYWSKNKALGQTFIINNSCKNVVEEINKSVDLFTKAAIRRCSLKQMFLKVSQYSLENTCLNLQAWNLIKKKIQSRCFPATVTKFLRTAFS